jgi:hypothetical protein
VFSLAFMGPLILSRLPACEDPVLRRRRSSTEHLRVVGKLSWGLAPVHLWIVLEQFQGRIEATTYEQSSGYPHPESFVALTGFALEGLRYAKRVYKKTTTG